MHNLLIFLIYLFDGLSNDMLFNQKIEHSQFYLFSAYSRGSTVTNLVTVMLDISLR